MRYFRSFLALLAVSFNFFAPACNNSELDKDGLIGGFSSSGGSTASLTDSEADTVSDSTSDNRIGDTIPPDADAAVSKDQISDSAADGSIEIGDGPDVFKDITETDVCVPLCDFPTCGNEDGCGRICGCPPGYDCPGDARLFCGPDCQALCEGRKCGTTGINDECDCAELNGGCADNNPCTRDVCNELGQCSNPTDNSGACEDADPCTMGDYCESGVCQSGDNQRTCNDGDACTDDSCVPGEGCKNAPKVCDDGDLCNGVSTCSNGTCSQTIAPVICKASDTCHVVGECNSMTGVCTNPGGNEGAICSDDNNLCNGVSTCVEGVCKETTAPVVCEAIDSCHEAGVCDTTTGKCTSAPINEDATCNDDGNLCNGVNTCKNGVCIQTTDAVVCTASDACHSVGICNPVMGKCTDPEGNDTAACDDKKACTKEDRCLGGICFGSEYSCNGHGTCNGTACNCNPGFAGDLCDRCSNKGPEWSAYPDCTKVGWYDALNNNVWQDPPPGGTYVWQDGMSYCESLGLGGYSDWRLPTIVELRSLIRGCSDPEGCAPFEGPDGGCYSQGGLHDLCSDWYFSSVEAGAGLVWVVAFYRGFALVTWKDRESSVRCVRTACPPSDACHSAGAWNPGTGQCTNPVGNEGAVCDDGNACNGVSTCSDGTCRQTTAPVTCTPLDSCHVPGICDPTTGVCSNPAGNEGAVCGNDANQCDGGDRCRNGICTATGPVVCTVLDDCHSVGTCNPSTGICTNPAGNDNSACNGGQGICKAGRCSVSFGFVSIAAGSFWMGSPEGTCPTGYAGSCTAELGRWKNETLHHVTLTKAFEMQVTEVTQGEWKAIFDDWNPSSYPACGAACPVETVSWYDALAFANKMSTAAGLPPCYELTSVKCEDGKDVGVSYGQCMNNAHNGIDSATVTLAAGTYKPYECIGYRLPTEAEWEYAARAGSTTAFYPSTGNDGSITKIGWGGASGLEPNLDRIGWYAGNCSAAYAGAFNCSSWYSGASTCGPQPTGRKAANAWGLKDMSGNVFEFTWDLYEAAYPSNSVEDPAGPSTGSMRVVRGGGWFDGNAEYCRSAARNSHGLGSRNRGLGFRLVRTL